jgi:hypothetical protein
MSRAMAKRVPDGMKVLVIPGGVFEWATWLMGLVPFCYALADQPDLVDAVIARVSDIIYAVVEDLMDEPNVGGIFMGDDLGYASGTIVSPKVLRQKFLPQTGRIVDLVHSADKLFLLHTCGNVYDIMDDLIRLGIALRTRSCPSRRSTGAGVVAWPSSVGWISTCWPPAPRRRCAAAPARSSTSVAQAGDTCLAQATR